MMVRNRINGFALLGMLMVAIIGLLAIGAEPASASPLMAVGAGLTSAGFMPIVAYAKADGGSGTSPVGGTEPAASTEPDPTTSDGSGDGETPPDDVDSELVKQNEALKTALAAAESKIGELEVAADAGNDDLTDAEKDQVGLTNELNENLKSQLETAKTSIEELQDDLSAARVEIGELKTEAAKPIDPEDNPPTAQQLAEMLPNALLLLEAGWIASNSDKYRRNTFVTNCARAWANCSGEAKVMQDRLDGQNVRRDESREELRKLTEKKPKQKA